MISATLKLEIGVRVYGRPSRQDVTELSDTVLRLIMDIVDEIVYWDHYIPESEWEFEEGSTWEFTETWEGTDSAENIFSSIEFWWEQFHSEEKP